MVIINQPFVGNPRFWKPPYLSKLVLELNFLPESFAMSGLMLHHVALVPEVSAILVGGLEHGFYCSIYWE